MLLYGRNPVLEAIADGRVAEVLVARGVEESFIRELKELDVLVRFTSRIEMDQMVGTTQHQGVVAEVEDLKWASVDDIFERAEARGEPLLIVLLDGITDPRNFGAIIRSAEVLGAHGVVVEERRSAPLSPVVAKTAAGAAGLPAGGPDQEPAALYRCPEGRQGVGVRRSGRGRAGHRPHRFFGQIGAGHRAPRARACAVWCAKSATYWSRFRPVGVCRA